MYFWRIENLKDQLRSGPLPARDTFGYLVLLAASQTLTGLLAGGYPRPDWVKDLPITVGIVLVWVTCLWLVYRANGGADGRDLAGRFLSLGWVLGLRFFVGGMLIALVLPVIGILLVAVGIPFEAIPIPTFVMSMFVLMIALVTWRMVHHLRDLQVPADPVS